MRLRLAPLSCILPRRLARGGLAAVLAMALGLSALSAAAAPSGWRLVNGPAGQPVALTLSGPAPSPQTGPTLVLQSGLGEDQTAWTSVAALLEGQHPVLRHDRPGYGHSDAVDGPRDPCQLATELHAVLHSAGVAPPYLLVGHSLGGLYQHAFARLYPDEVAGLLLLDPTHPEHLARLQEEDPALALTLKLVRWTLFSAMARREFDEQAVCRERLLGPPTQPVPTRLLASTVRAPLETAAFATMLERLRGDWLRLTGAAQVERVPGAGHDLPRERPDLVAAAAHAMAQTATARPQPTGSSAPPAD